MVFQKLVPLTEELVLQNLLNFEGNTAFAAEPNVENYVESILLYLLQLGSTCFSFRFASLMVYRWFSHLLYTYSLIWSIIGHLLAAKDEAHYCTDKCSLHSLLFRNVETTKFLHVDQICDGTTLTQLSELRPY